MIPKPSIWMIRLSLMCLLFSALIGGLLLLHKAIDIHPMLWTLLPVHYELAIWGWMVQFLMGTAYWIFPKSLSGERRGPEAPAWIMVVLFNAGILILVVSSLCKAENHFMIAGRSLLVISVIIFGLLMWWRIVSYRNVQNDM